MKQRGRKSASELSVVRPLSVELPEPPANYSDEQSATWSQILASKPADWWDAGTLPLLDAYVRAITEHGRITDLIERMHPLAGFDEFKEYDQMQRTQDRLQSQMARLATKMRLSQQSKYGARGADGAASRASSKGKPWDS
jgi:hypothetical protein